MDLANLMERLGDWRRFGGVRSRALAAALEALILEGDLPAGTRLPPERRFADRLGVSRTLVVAAYTALRDAGWIASRQGSGSYVAKGPPGYAAATRRRQSMRNPMALRPGAGGAVIDLSLAAAMPDPAWLHLSPAARGEILTEYPYQPQGMPRLRERIAAHLSRQGVPSEPAQILVTGGAQQAISLLAARYGGNGRRVLIEEPTFFGAIDCLRAAGAELAPVPIERSAGGPAAMIAAMSAAGSGKFAMAYICPTVQNPTGTTWSAAERRALVRAAARSDTLLVIDDSLSDLAFHGAPPSPAHYDLDAPVATIGSLSKTLWGGLRVGWVRANAAIVAALTADRLTQDLGGSSINAAIACDLLDRYDALLKARRAALRRQRDAWIAALRRHLPEWRFTVPDGGMFLWVRLPHGNADDFVPLAREHGVLLTSGSVLTVRGTAENRIRISYAQPAPVWDEAARRLRAAWDAFTR
ncbi:MAG TPA: PLP-dependent aminotransferase family protein [Paucimonas sp.]|nr:PLP-dependent aminotransferase family protein [Paucimonas sp.]